MILQELLAHVEDAPGVGLLVAIEQLAPSSTSACAIIGSRPAQASTSPRMSAVLPSGCCSSTGVMSFSVSFTLCSARTRKMCGSVPRVTATRLPLRSSILAIVRVLAGDQRGPFRPRIDVDRLDRIAVDLGDQRRRARGRAEVDRAGVEEFQRLVGAERLHPADADAVLGEFLLQQALFLEHHRDRIVGRPVDADFLGLVGGERSRSAAAPASSGREQKRTSGQSTS